MDITEESLKYVNNRFYLDDELILDGDDLIHNYSHIPMKPGTMEGFRSVPELILNNRKVHESIFTDTESAEHAQTFCIMDVLLAEFLLHRTEGYKVAEFGCTFGNYSIHLAQLLASFDRESSLVCITDTIGNNSGNTWLDAISMVEAPEGLSFMATDYGKTMLGDGIFDCAVINGTCMMDSPGEVLDEALRVTKENGMILCYSYQQYLLDDMFRLKFRECREYRIDADRVIYQEI